MIPQFNEKGWMVCGPNQPNRLSDYKSGKWLADAKGKAGERGYEISVVHSDFKHGFVSCGWPGVEKIILFEDTHNQQALPPEIWNDAVQFAEKWAEKLSNR